MIQDRLFDYKGFRNKSGYYKNKAKRLIGKGLSKTEVLNRRKKLIEYYKKNPKALSQKGKSESKESFNKKLNSVSSRIVARRHNNLNKAIKSTGSKYKKGSYTSSALKYTAPLAVVPVPGTSIAPIAAAGIGTLADKAKMSKLRKHNAVRDADNQLNKLEKEIKLDDKLQYIQRKKLELSKS